MSSAATITNVEFSNGDVEIQGTGGTTANATFRVEVPVNEVVEFIQLDPAGDNLGPVDHSVGGTLGLQEGTHYVKLPVKLPPNTGTYDLDWQTAGIFGGQRSINGDDMVNGGSSFSGALRVVAGSSSNSSSTPVGAPSEYDDLISRVNSLTALIEAYIKMQTATSTKPGCPPVFTGANRVEVQTWLMAHGYASRFHAVGVYSPTEPGVIWGTVSSTAYADAQLACK